jgi:hypothetical protein
MQNDLEKEIFFFAQSSRVCEVTSSQNNTAVDTAGLDGIFEEICFTR